MAVQVLQYPASCSLAQSPIIFTVKESDTGVIASSSFQYVGELYYWTGSISSPPSTANFTLAKYPNESQAGIFDVGKIINSTLQDVVQEQSSSMQYFKVDFYHQYIQNNAFVTSSHVMTGVYRGLDGYGVFQEPIGQNINDKTPHWPLMTDGPTTQSIFDTNTGRMGVYVGSGAGTPPTSIQYVGSGGETQSYNISGTTATTGQITSYPIGYGDADFPLTAEHEWYTVQARIGGGGVGTPIRFEVNCEKKYPNVRLKWKNRFGQFDFLNFNLVSEESFTTDIKTFQQQLGSWGGNSLSYNNYDSSVQNYSAISTQTIKVNSDWLDEAYNDILKQLMVSDEIYWLYNESSGDLRPITIKTNSITFKTGVKDKLIQYSFDFEYGQNYKLIL